MATRDISSKGAFVNTSVPLPVGTDVRLEMKLVLKAPGGGGSRTALVRATGSVLRVEPGGMAVVFDRSSKVVPVSAGTGG
jgi:hypothetical protein